MAQFDLYKGPSSSADYLIDLQDDMLQNLSTRVVAPLVAPDKLGPPMKTLNPRIWIGGEPYILLLHLLAAIPATTLGSLVASAKSQRTDIIGAIDLLFTGI